MNPELCVLIPQIQSVLPMILTSYLNGLSQVRLPLLAFYLAIRSEAIDIKGSDGGFSKPRHQIALANQSFSDS
jgi:hypothetical protein